MIHNESKLRVPFFQSPALGFHSALTCWLFGLIYILFLPWASVFPPVKGVEVNHLSDPSSGDSGVTWTTFLFNTRMFSLPRVCFSVPKCLASLGFFCFVLFSPVLCGQILLPLKKTLQDY